MRNLYTHIVVTLKKMNCDTFLNVSAHIYLTVRKNTNTATNLQNNSAFPFYVKIKNRKNLKNFLKKY